MTRPTVFVAGTDIGARTLWTWQWHDSSAPGYAVVDAQKLESGRKALAMALPDPIPGVDKPGENTEIGELVGNLDATAARLRRFDVFAVARCLTGAMSDQDAEICLSETLAKAFLPCDLAREVERRCSSRDPGLFRVLPPPSAYAVPWELLPIGDRRLIELADIVQVAPPLGRDGTGVHPRPWTDSPPLRVVDPADRPPVLAKLKSDDADKHAERYGWAANELGQRYTPEQLSHDLTRAARSRLLWVGHVSSADGTPGSVALEMSNDPRAGPTRLSAVTLFLDGGAAELPGTDQAWPSPSRVALIACRSGADMSHIEPFGLVVAFLQAGAELVTATKWTLPTDLAIAGVMRHRGAQELAPGRGPFNLAAREVDRIQSDPDPVRALGQWQRQRLQDWRSSGSLLDSPIIWAALANHHAPFRAVRDD